MSPIVTERLLDQLHRQQRDRPDCLKTSSSLPERVRSVAFWHILVLRRKIAHELTSYFWSG